MAGAIKPYVGPLLSGGQSREDTHETNVYSPVGTAGGLIFQGAFQPVFTEIGNNQAAAGTISRAIRLAFSISATRKS